MNTQAPAGDDTIRITATRQGGSIIQVKVHIPALAWMGPQVIGMTPAAAAAHLRAHASHSPRAHACAVEHACAMALGAPPADADTQIATERALAAEMADTHLRRLLINLLDNALRHASGKPSSIRVITQPSGNEHIRLSVWSDGQALEASVMRHLFEPFFSSESRSSGLGLYICRELCERYGAQIAYQRSRLDQREGNEFFVLLPSATASGQPAQQSPAYPVADSVPGMTRPGVSQADPPSLSTR